LKVILAPDAISKDIDPDRLKTLKEFKVKIAQAFDLEVS
jgi:hypothetical protein